MDPFLTSGLSWLQLLACSEVRLMLSLTSVSVGLGQRLKVEAVSPHCP